MLCKLLKYEWKAIWKVFVIINAFTVFVTILGMFAMNTLASGNGSFEGDASDVIAILIFLLYYATIIGVSCAMTIYIAIRFYRNLYTDEGYLMHTLPVTKRQLLNAKLLTHSACMLITVLLVGISICVLLLPLFSVLMDDPAFSPSYALAELAKDCIGTYGIPLSAFLLCAVIANIICIISSILAIYCAISLGQTFQKHKIMGSILCYIGITCLLQTVNMILMMPQMLLSISGQKLNLAVYLNNTLLTASIISLFTGILFYLITLHMMNKKLNLD